ncbi:endonuclease/exonuclease/phosphatase family protein [Pseudomonas sp. MPFS]|uniref:endonuclease/exonuclease/phosphatase family protein n=1 Tax=Pseudomonas sp. MPFS TaxID=2795724 RepID=UPI001F129808|nr:endonuclease/exonuclease/phosphatase family protein [Pseudomonas sp. MPFS]UMZ14027.1 endonuclease/exonuclease/phosphatase family protein [Pseudomonas sp. MPFS]
MDLKIAWWNTGMSPPTTRKSAQGKRQSEGFLTVLRHLLVEDEVDLLGLCEVSPKEISAITMLLSGLEKDFKVISLYSIEGNRIQDFCAIINESKIQYLEHHFVGRKDEAGVYYKVGVKVKFIISDGAIFNVYLSHWQSRRTVSDKPHRAELGSALRASINTVFEMDGENSHVVLMGDYNDDPYEDSMTHHLKATRDKSFVLANKAILYNPFWREMGALIPYAHADRPLWDYPYGTCYFKQNKEMTYWKTFDQILFSSSFFGDGSWHLSEGETKIYSMVEFGCYFDKWSVVSDHLPVATKLMRV